MEDKLNLYQKLQKCRVELQKSELKKSGHNKYADFKYYELSDFLPKVNELFDKYKLFSQFTLSREIATLEIFDSEKKLSTTDSGFEIYDSVIFTNPVADLEMKGSNAIQNLGAINTYLKRYLYLNALEIIENDSFDAVSGKPAKKSVTRPKKEMPNKDKLVALCKEKGINLNDIAKNYHLTAKSTDDDFLNVLKQIESVEVPTIEVVNAGNMETD